MESRHLGASGFKVPVLSGAGSGRLSLPAGER